MSTTYTPDFPVNMVAYFTDCLDKAKAAKEGHTHGPIKWPTVKAFCQIAHVNHNTMRGWARYTPALRQALNSCADIRLQISRLELDQLVYDTEVEP
jgi:hypothetical protein